MRSARASPAPFHVGSSPSGLQTLDQYNQPMVQENYCGRSWGRLLLQPMVGKDSSNASESVLAVTARGCCRCDFHILAENGLKGFISVHHGTEHQGLVEKKWILEE